VAAPVTQVSHSIDDADTVRWEGRGVKATAVAARLLDLRSSASDDEGFPLARASVMNLLVFASDDSQAKRAIETVDDLALRHPSRAIVIAGSPGKRFSLDAEVAIHQHPLGTHGLIYERVFLRPHGANLEGMDTLVIPLLIPHLQSYLWWMGDPNPAHPALRSLARICDRLIVDSALGSAEVLSDVSVELGPGSPLGSRGTGPTFGNLVMGDANWTRLDGFRQALAAIFDEHHRAQQLEGLTRVEVVGARAASRGISAAELLMAGWIASRMGCTSPGLATGGVSMRCGEQTSRTLFTFAGTPARALRTTHPRPPLHAVSLEMEHGRKRIKVDLTAQRAGGLCTVSESGAATTSRAVPLSHPSESETISRELARIGRDRVYEDSVLSAARIQAALSP
jgi:glucose-6-phosphate dehydrogenase assembly protein OpcA